MSSLAHSRRLFVGMLKVQRDESRVDEADDQRGTSVGAERVNLVKVFSATKAKHREELGERLAGWLTANEMVAVCRAVVVQSSDRQFHCISIVLICRSRAE